MHNTFPQNKTGCTGSNRPARNKAQHLRNFSIACAQYEALKRGFSEQANTPSDYEAKCHKAARKAGL